MYKWIQLATMFFPVRLDKPGETFFSSPLGRVNYADFRRKLIVIWVTSKAIIVNYNISVMLFRVNKTW